MKEVCEQYQLDCDSEHSCNTLTLRLQNNVVLRHGLVNEEVCLPRVHCLNSGRQ